MALTYAEMATILIIEDDRSIAELLAYMAERDGHSVEVLHDGEAAHHHFVAAQAPDLILLDAMLPYRDGLTLLAEMRALPVWNRVPVIMLTARTLEKDIVAALDAGASDYVIKPFQPQELMARVRRLLGTREVR